MQEERNTLFIVCEKKETLTVIIPVDRPSRVGLVHESGHDPPLLLQEHERVLHLAEGDHAIRGLAGSHAKAVDVGRLTVTKRKRKVYGSMDKTYFFPKNVEYVWLEIRRTPVEKKNWKKAEYLYLTELKKESAKPCKENLPNSVLGHELGAHPRQARLAQCLRVVEPPGLLDSVVAHHGGGEAEPAQAGGAGVDVDQEVAALHVAVDDALKLFCDRQDN